MSEKIKIGENEYQPPFRVEATGEDAYNICYDLVDADGVAVGVYQFNNSFSVDGVATALNELAGLRAERDALKEEIREAVYFIETATGYNASTSHEDAAAWLQRNKTTKGGE